MSPPALSNERDRSLIRLAGLAGISWGAYLLVAGSAQSLHEAGSGRHSLLGLLALFGCACVCYLAAIRVALRAPQTWPLLGLIVGAGILFRATLLFSHTIEEVDLYRYLWDGAAVVEGVNPFRFTPQQVLASSDDGTLPEDLARLVRLRDRSPEMTLILQRVHFGELPTIYPPVSQAVFGLCGWLTPSSASLFTRMVLMKSWFVLFDLVALMLVIRLLAVSGRPPGAALIYAWCPLLIKEIANSGHLDALAFCLTAGAAYVAVQIAFTPERLRSPQRTGIVAAVLLGLAVGAKLYPVILAPLVMVTLIRRRGWRGAVLPAATFALLSSLLAWPMWPTASPGGTQPQIEFDAAQVAVASDGAPPAPPQEVAIDPHDPSQSLRAFLSEWEMNDFLFLLAVENLRPTSSLAPHETAWFSVFPENWRTSLVAFVGAHVPVAESRVPFFLARALTSTAFLVIASGLAWRGSEARTAADWLNAAFLTVAWFWLLLPTQNPWYWTWALPFLPFARLRTWLVVSGLAFVYYLRFWLTSNFPEVPVLGTPYRGPLFFDYVVTWVEFGPWFIALILSSLWRRSGLPASTACRS